MGNGRPDLRRVEDMEDGVFEIGLVLAGAVSGGAYTAGVLDFLIQALDSWEAAKEKEILKEGPDPKKWSIPGHKIRIRVVTGASAGSMCGAVLAAASNYDFPHVNKGNHSEVGGENPFFSAWVKEIDISNLLDCSDLEQAVGIKDVASILNSQSITEIGKHAIAYSCPEPVSRTYLEDPMRYIFTLANLRGVQYFLPQKALKDFYMTAHSDYRSFSVFKVGGTEPGPVYSDEFPVHFPNSSNGADWLELLASAIASGAFPVGLAGRTIQRPAKEYRLREVIAPGSDGEPALALPLMPVIPGDSDPYRFAAVDGGAMDNEPLELARTELSGIMGRNPRSGVEARRAVILVDPFPNLAEDGPMSADLLNVLSAPLKLMTAWKNQARFKPVDVALAMDTTIYSRYAVYPSRTDEGGERVVGPRAIAAGALGGFSGFLSESYRLHDYLLGRMNCRAFLKDLFTVPGGNPMVADFWSDAARNDGRFSSFDVTSGVREYCLIPLLGECEEPQEPIPWPKSTFDPGDESLQDLLGTRLDKLIQILLHSIGLEDNAFTSVLDTILETGIRKKAIAAINEKINSELKQHDLI